MDVVIIEDERLVSEDLSEILRSIDKTINITGTLASVKEAVAYFKSGAKPQLIFSDVQLGDGYSFEIFNKMHHLLPVIYCTAYDQHALKAFEKNGIAYVLKPYTRASIKQALEKYKSLKKNLNDPQPVPPVAVPVHAGGIKSLLVNSRNRIIPVRISDIAFFSIENKTTILFTFLNENFSVSHTLDELEEICGSGFFRANRQILLNKNSVKDVVHYGFRKLFVNLQVETSHEVVINKEKISLFLNWLKK
jgi:two-component system, LytTR family, response regulator LytT